METTKTGENLQETWRVVENIMSKNTNSIMESYNQQLNFWNNYLNNMMHSFTNNSKNWTKLPFGNSNSVNDMWMNWFKTAYNYSWPNDGLNFGKSMNQSSNDFMEFSKTTFNDYQQRLNQFQKSWMDFNKSMNEYIAKQSDILNQYLSVFIQSGNKMSDCLSESQKNFISEITKQNEKSFLTYQSVMNELMKSMQQKNESDLTTNKDQVTTDIKRKTTSPVVVQ